MNPAVEQGKGFQVHETPVVCLEYELVSDKQKHSSQGKDWLSSAKL